MRLHVRHPRKLLALGNRYVASLVASLLLLAQLSGFAHLLFVRHAVCAEHGELVHVGEGGRVADVSATKHATAPALVADAKPSTEHGHDHCSLAAHRQHGTQASRRQQGLAEVRHYVPRAYVQQLGHGPRIALFRLAPKSSPPA